MEYDLIKLAIKGDIDKLEDSLKRSADEVNVKNNIGYSPLAFAVIRGHLEAVKVLIKYGADVNNQDIYGKTPLHYLGDDNPDSEGNQEQIAKLLIDNGADLSLLDDYDNSALLAMVLYIGYDDVRVPVVKAMLEAGADVDKKNKSGFNAMTIAQRDKDENMIDLLQSFKK